MPIILLMAFSSCTGPGSKKQDKEPENLIEQKTVGSILRSDPGMDSIVSESSQIEVLAEGFDWTEGPLWVEDGGYLLFADIPPNRLYRWKEGEGASVYLEPSGYTGKEPRGGEPGANGLLLNSEGQLVLCQHGDRRIAKMDAPLENPKSVFTTIAHNYQGMQFNSPNDATFHSSGELYLTDPPYGLEQLLDDPKKQTPFQGVYRVRNDGQVDLLTDELSRPNGIAFSPDEKTLYVTNSDPERAIWMAYDVDEGGSVSNGRIFFDATDKTSTEKGLPDGLKVNSEGIIFATGPGGVYVFSPDATVLGIIQTGEATSNCALDTDEKYLYITADMYLLRVKLG